MILQKYALPTKHGDRHRLVLRKVTKYFLVAYCVVVQLLKNLGGTKTRTSCGYPLANMAAEACLWLFTNSLFMCVCVQHDVCRSIKE